MNYIFLLLFIILGLLSHKDFEKFISFEGKMKRGLFVDKAQLSMEMESFFRTLQDDIIITDTSSFIKKRDQIVLVQPTRYVGGRLHHFRYIGYIDLSGVNPCIEYRSSLYVLYFLILLIGALIFGIIDQPFSDNVSYIFIFVPLLLITIIFHLISKRMVNIFIEQFIHPYT